METFASVLIVLLATILRSLHKILTLRKARSRYSSPCIKKDLYGLLLNGAGDEARVLLTRVERQFRILPS